MTAAPPRMGPFDFEHHDLDARRRWPVVLLAVALAVLLGAGLFVAWLQRQINPPGPVGPATRITVEQGMSTGEIGDLLEREGVITSATVFRFYARLTSSGTIEAGDYTLRKRDGLAQVLDVLHGGARVDLGRPLTVPEGLTLPEVAELVGKLPGRSAQRFLEVARSGAVRSQYQPSGSTNLEGLVLPETYFVGSDEDETDVLRRMVDAFDKLAGELNLVAAAARLGLSPYQAVVVASMVEREARVAEDRGKVARVIFNRLDRKMLLQIDATVLFALGQQKPTVSEADTRVDSPYNTYRVAGLPPGPIASPGRKALEATLSPAPGPWIYYVLADASGRHAFTDSFSEFQRLADEATKKGLR